MNRQEILFSATATFLLFNDVGVALYISLEGELLDMESEEKLQPLS